MHGRTNTHCTADNCRASGANFNPTSCAHRNRATHCDCNGDHNTHKDINGHGNRYTNADLHPHQYGDATSNGDSAQHRDATSNGSAS
jgi:hypothetical protein